MMTFQNELFALQRHDIDIAANSRRVAVARPRASVSTRLGHALIGAGSRLVADRPSVARLH